MYSLISAFYAAERTGNLPQAMKNKEMLFSKASKLAPILVSFVINEIRFVDVDFTFADQQLSIVIVITNPMSAPI